MHVSIRPIVVRTGLALSLASLLSACGMSNRLAEVGVEPRLASIENPVQQQGYQPVSLPMPSPEPPARNANSLWRSGARAFFKDQRASRVGDLLTVNITIDDSAKFDNTTTRSRSSGEDASLPSFLGIETKLAQVLPEAVNPSSLVNLEASSSSTGKGSVDRKENLKVTLAALVTQILPNGNLIIRGRQEVRVNYELRQLTVTGVVRPEDISSTNTISGNQIAEARISYGGRGQLSSLQQPRYGQQIFDIIFPF